MHRTTWMAMTGAAALATAVSTGVLLARRRQRQLAADERDAALEQELDDSFPASDPPSHTPTTGARAGW